MMISYYPILFRKIEKQIWKPTMIFKRGFWNGQSFILEVHRIPSVCDSRVDKLKFWSWIHFFLTFNHKESKKVKKEEKKILVKKISSDSTLLTGVAQVVKEKNQEK